MQSKTDEQPSNPPTSLQPARKVSRPSSPKSAEDLRAEGWVDKW